MVVLLVGGWAHPNVASAARASRVMFRADVDVIETKARAVHIFDPVMIGDVYHHEP